MRNSTPSTAVRDPESPPRTTPRTTRRTALRGIGLGCAAVAVAGATGLTARAVTGGVFSTGTGPAYDAWDAARAGTGPDALVRAAVLASNAHDAQPWTFTVGEDRIDVHADLSRTLGTMDPLLRELHVSLGCATENLVVAGAPHGLEVEPTWLPDPSDPGLVASVALTRTPVRQSALFDAVPHRHTDRNAYALQAVGAGDLAGLGALADVADVQLVWLTGAAERRAFADLTLRATQAIIDDVDQARDDFRWYRSSWGDLQEHQDGITIDPSGQSPLIRAVSKLVPTSRAQDNAGWLRGTRDVQLPTASAFGALVVDGPGDPRQWLDVGRIWQRLHLTATTMGLSVQPLCQVPERIDREESAGLSPDVTDAMADLLPAGARPVMTFRIGRPTVDSLRSPRRPAEDVVRRVSAS